MSGYGIYLSYGDSGVDKNYIWKRLKGVYFPYIIMKVIVLAGYLALGFKEEISIQDITSILFVEDWFIHVIVLQYIMFYVLEKIANKKYICLGSLIIDLMLSIIFVIEEKPIGWFNALWLFTVGMIIAKYECEIIIFFENKLCLKVCVLLVMFMTTGIIFAVYKGSMWANMIKPISGVFLILAICGVYRKYSFKSNLMDWSGKRSMYLYIVHINMWNYTVGIDDLIFRMIISVLLTVIISEVLYKLIDFMVGNMRLKQKRRL